jgi:hypothetical protein
VVASSSVVWCRVLGCWCCCFELSFILQAGEVIAPFGNGDGQEAADFVSWWVEAVAPYYYTSARGFFQFQVYDSNPSPNNPCGNKKDTPFAINCRAVDSSADAATVFILVFYKISFVIVSLSLISRISYCHGTFVLTLRNKTDH